MNFGERSISAVSGLNQTLTSGSRGSKRPSGPPCHPLFSRSRRNSWASCVFLLRASISASSSGVSGSSVSKGSSGPVTMGLQLRDTLIFLRLSRWSSTNASPATQLSRRSIFHRNCRYATTAMRPHPFAALAKAGRQTPEPRRGAAQAGTPATPCRFAPSWSGSPMPHIRERFRKMLSIRKHEIVSDRRNPYRSCAETGGRWNAGQYWGNGMQPKLVCRQVTDADPRHGGAVYRRCMREDASCSIESGWLRRSTRQDCC